jgi:hypothetical protein
MSGFVYGVSTDFNILIAFSMAPVEPLPVGKATYTPGFALNEFNKLL